MLLLDSTIAVMTGKTSSTKPALLSRKNNGSFSSSASWSASLGKSSKKRVLMASADAFTSFISRIRFSRASLSFRITYPVVIRSRCSLSHGLILGCSIISNTSILRMSPSWPATREAAPLFHIFTISLTRNFIYIFSLFSWRNVILKWNQTKK